MNPRRAGRTVALAALAACGIVVAAWVSWLALTWVGPSLGAIPQFPALDPPEEYLGAPAGSRPLRRQRIPQHPFMAPNGDSVIHVDAYMSDAHRVPGPLGRAPQVSSRFMVGECGTVTFDREGRLVTVCVRPRDRFLALLDPTTLEVLDEFELPPRQGGIGPFVGPGAFGDVSGGGYFYLDHRRRAVIPTTTNHLWVVEPSDGGEFELASDIDLSSVVSDDDSLLSALPDWDGRVWFVSSEGVVGYVTRSGHEPAAIELGEGIDNSFAVDESGGVFVVSDRALYRFEAERGEPKVVWRESYPNGRETKPGQFGDGSGTTPTLLGRRWVAIADNADPMGLMVFERGERPDAERVVCRQPVFEPTRGATENTLVGIGHSLVVENNYGYEGPLSTLLGGTTEPGLARVDIERGGRGCRLRWTSDERSPTVVPKLSLATGLLYAYTKPAGATSAPWYLTAIDFRTGETVFKVQAGRGLGFNNHYAPITLGSDGAAYVGVLGGIVRIADGAD